MSIPFYDDQLIASHLDYLSVAAILEQAFCDLAEGQASIHARQRSECADFRLSSMGGIWAAQGVAAVKVYPTVQGNFSFLVNLFDLKQNKPLAVLQGNELTRFRTAAQTALIASKVAKDARKLALFGAGFQGRAHAEALCERFQFAEICIVDPKADAGWCSRLALLSGSSVKVCSPQAAVAGADIIITTTRSTTPVFAGEDLPDKTFVAAVGISSPKGRELDDATLNRAARIIVEWKPQSLQEAGELVLWQRTQDDAQDKIIDFMQLFGNQPPWPGPETGITVFKTVGTGLADLAGAYLAYQRIQQSMGGQP